jgi:predicted MFS family arabinose efflux permease
MRVFKAIGRNNRLFMLANFIGALSVGLSMKFRPLYLARLGASPEQIGTALALGSATSIIGPFVGGILSNRMEPKRVILIMWSMSVLGFAIMALSPTWPVATLGLAIDGLVVVSSPAVVMYVLLNAKADGHEASPERVLTFVFASGSAALAFAPALGGLIAERFSIRAAILLGAAGYALATGVMALAGDVEAERQAERRSVLTVFQNRTFRTLVMYYMLVNVVLYVGYALAPNFLEDTRRLHLNTIGLLYSVGYAGTVVCNLLVGRLKPRWGYAALLLTTWIGLAILGGMSGPLWSGAALFLMGGIYTMRAMIMAGTGHVFDESERDMALGAMEGLSNAATAAASWLAGMLYDVTPSHNAPIIAGLAGIPLALILLLFAPVAHQPSEASLYPVSQEEGVQ